MSTAIPEWMQKQRCEPSARYHWPLFRSSSKYQAGRQRGRRAVDIVPAVPVRRSADGRQLRGTTVHGVLCVRGTYRGHRHSCHIRHSRTALVHRGEIYIRSPSPPPRWIPRDRSLSASQIHRLQVKSAATVVATVTATVVATLMVVRIERWQRSMCAFSLFNAKA